MTILSPSASLLVVTTLLILISPTTALFVQPPSKIKPYPDLKLAAADRLGISYKSIAKDAGKAASLAGFALSLNAQFGRLDEASFRALLREYCGLSETKSRVIYAKDREYTLLDFLPPLMQAVSGLHFQSSRTKQGRGLPSFVGDRIQKFDVTQEVLLTSNCWGFAWEVLFQADNADVSAITISTADPTSAWREFTGPAFDLIQSSRTQPKLLTLSERDFRNKKLKAGDVLLIWHSNPSTASGTDLYLDHVATCIDEDVYYEKSGSGDKVPFRVNTWAGLVANFPPFVFFWEWRRLVRNNPLSPKVYGSPETRLKPATELFGVDAQLAATGGSSLRLQSRFSLLSKLRPSVAQKISLQADTGDNGLVEAQTYTGILVLEDLRFDETTGRAYLPKSAFMPEWYMQAQQMLLPSNNNPYL
jgi:hypothetical protein